MMPNVHVLALHGEIDLSTKEATRAQLRYAEGLDAAFVILDLSEVSYIDSTFLGLLMSFQKQLWDGNGATLTIVVATGSNVGRVLHIAGFDSLFAVYDNLSTAHEGARSQPSRPATWQNRLASD